MSPDPNDDSRLETILVRWFETRNRVGAPSLAALCAEADATDLLPRVERLLAHDAALLGTDRANDRRSDRVLVQRIGDYRLLARIGSGGMSEVFLARQESLDRHVALKVLRPELVDDPTRRLRFQREAEITAALEHPNIVPVYEIGEADTHVYLAMRLVAG
ncbi:MAG: protein kinase, partial [Planctomycetes bacterium]|nr:protein kinase [Planctomycetota bacterium]